MRFYYDIRDIMLSYRQYGERTNEGPCKKISGAKTR
nr:MAG TPA: hypothetical protein [Caudoviricetes sp.]